MPVMRHALVNDRAGGDFQCSEQGRDAMALVVVRHRAGTAFLQRQAWLGSIQRLDLALFIDGEDEMRIGGNLEVVHPVRCQTLGSPASVASPASGDSSGVQPRSASEGPIRASAATRALLS